MRIIQFVCFVFLFNIINPCFGQILRERPGTSKPAEPKPAKPAQPKPSGSESVTPGPNRLVLKIITDARCTIYVDGESRGIAEPGVVKKIGFAPGEYILKWVSTERKEAEGEQELSYEKNDMGVEKMYKVELAEQVDEIKSKEQGEVLVKQAASEALEALFSNMVRVEGGSFEMGCTAEQTDCGDDEKPVHRVELSTFYMSKYEVTQALWVAVMGSNPSKFSGCAQCPVESVSFDDVQVFLQKLNAKTGKQYLLPTEAEWEYAARGGNKCKSTQYSGGSNMDAVGWYKGNSGSKTHPVGLKQANELGLYDMSGNVWEWCSDWYAENYYASSPGRDPMGSGGGEYRVRRGGSWLHSPALCRSATRVRGSPATRGTYLGFRLVLPSR